MNKEFWERIDRLEELAEKATRPDWDIHVKGDNAYATNVDFLQADNLRYIAAANPAMILEMLATFKGRLSYLEHKLTETDIQLGNAQEHIKRLEKQVNWLAMSCQNVRKFPTMNGKPEDDWTAYKWREAARKAVVEADNA